MTNRSALATSLFLVACGSTAAPPPRAADAAAPAEDASSVSVDAGGGADASGDGATEAAAPPTPLATCVAAEGTCSGTLDPTTLGPGIVAIRSVTSGKDGRHFFCYPLDPAKVNGKLVIHVVGTGSDPQVDLAVTRRMCALGFVTLAPMYPNERDARSTCGADPDCFEGFRREIVRGEDTIVGVSVDKANSIEGRVASALAKLAATEPAYASFAAFRDAFAARSFANVVLSGHSQGSGHALYLAREYAASRVVLLAGPSDRVPPPSRAPATWLTTFAARTKTPPANLYGFISEDDGIQSFDDVMDTWSLVGVGAESCVHSATGAGYAASCRRVVLPAAGCAALEAHSVVVAENFDASCRAGRPPNRNTATWRFLFGVP